MITLTREEAQQVLDALENLASMAGAAWTTDNPIETLRARLAQPEPEPWAGVDFDIKTAPPQREWQGLTDEELLACYSNRGNVFYRAIEAKLKEKNT